MNKAGLQSTLGETGVHWDIFSFWAPEQILVTFIYKLNMHIIQLYIKHL